MKLPRLREWRERRGFTQQEIADLAGVARDSVSKWETHQRGAHPTTARSLAKALGIDVEDLTGYPKALAPTIEELLKESHASSRWGALSAREWQEAIETADAARAKEIYEEIEDERQATFVSRRMLFASDDEGARNTSARLTFRYMTRGSQAALRTRDQRLIEEIERLGAEVLAGSAGRL